MDTHHGMKKIYSASNLMEAQIVLDLLAHAYIPAQIFNEHAQGVAGEIPFTHAYPEVWVKRDEDYARGSSSITVASLMSRICFLPALYPCICSICVIRFLAC